MTQPIPTAVVVPEDLRSWSVPWPGYHPVDVTPAELRPGADLAASVRDGWAEPDADPTAVDFTPRQATALVPYEVIDGRPRNPAGRTGRTGRALGRWGENTAADPIVIAESPGCGQQVLLIRRDDCGHWAIPGGMVEPGETAPAALARELHEETGVDLSTVAPTILDRTYVADPRNTDEAWICSTVALFQVPNQLPAQAASDATDARWWPFDSLEQLHRTVRSTGAELYAAHAPLLAAAHQRLLQNAH